MGFNRYWLRFKDESLFELSIFDNADLFYGDAGFVVFGKNFWPEIFLTYLFDGFSRLIVFFEIPEAKGDSVTNPTRPVF